MWSAAITGLFSVLGSGIKGFFTTKEAQMKGVESAIEAINQSNISAGEKEKAISQVISAEVNNGYWLSSVWRPLLMVTLAGIVVAYAFGFTTPNMVNEIPEKSMIGNMFELLKIGVMGYMPLRTVEKIVDKININKLIDKFTKK
jgi:hypothetical protein